MLTGAILRVFPEAVASTPAPLHALRLLRAAPEALAAVEADLLLEAIAGGYDALLVCGDNRLDAYGLLARARRLGLEDAVADGIVLARAFTLHQFVALLEETLPRMSEGRHVGLALVTGALEPFHDEDVTEAESRVLVPRVLRGLDALASSSGFPVVATTHRYVGAIALLAEGVAPDVVDARPRLVAGRQSSLDSFAEAM